MKNALAILLLFLAAGCASTEVAPTRTKALFHDSRFAAATERIDPAEIFAVSVEMRRYVRVEIARQLEDKGWQAGLVDALYKPGQLRLQYDSEITRTAAQAFEARSGNCLSLVIMTAALARELGLAVNFRRVFSDEAWSLVGDFQVASTHVNVTLAGKQNDPRVLFRDRDRDQLTIDFMPAARGRAYRGYSISEATIVAMFMNNRAAESIARGRVDDAYWYARAAIGQDPEFLAAYNTLAIVYHRRAMLDAAHRVLAHVLALEADNTFALSNQVLVLQGMGRMEEAAAVARRLAQLEPQPPFHFFDRGRAAMKAGDYRQARELFSREVQRDSSYHEFHFWLAAAHFALGEVAPARQHLETALKNSTTRGDRELYAAKLDRIR
jgi:tetratricopeptide (TPR) repeat protein